MRNRGRGEEYERKGERLRVRRNDRKNRKEGRLTSGLVLV